MDRRDKLRFPFNREMRYKLLENDSIIAAGEGAAAANCKRSAGMPPFLSFPPGPCAVRS
jgi:hypothetical protein